MILVPIRQGGPEWLRWRRGGLGASDAPAILGVSPFPEQTPRLLWDRLTGQGGGFEQTFAMRRGQRLEPIARKLWEGRTGLRVAPMCGVHDEHAWMRASLDGLTILGDLVLEIKAPNRDCHAEALAGDVPNYYVPQVQHQLAVSGAPLAHYASYSEHKDFAGGEQQLAIVPVEPDAAYIGWLIEAEARFWDCVRRRIPPGWDVVGTCKQVG